MSFESGGDIDNPFDDEDENDDQQADMAENADSEETSSVDDNDTRSETPPEQSTTGTRDTGKKTAPNPEADSSQGASGEVDYISDLHAGQMHSPGQLARALMEPEYHSESPPVPYATWRDGTSTGRNRTTLELNQDVDALVRKAQAEFEDRYGTNITKADLREFAMVYGLAHLDDVFEMAEEWGIQYDN